MNLKVMTFNLRVDAEGDGINRFPNRESRILDAIRAEDPDLIGFQEAYDHAREFLKRSLSDRYTLLGCGRGKNYRGEACCIAFKRDLFELISFETKFLSSTPNIPASRYAESDQSSCPRLYVHAELSHGELSTPIHFFNTHLDHKGEEARLLGMTQIMQRASEIDGPWILTGDMNALPDARCIRLPLSLSALGITDATAKLTHTFHGFGKYTEGKKIDYIFTNMASTKAYTVKDTPSEGVYISDHYPVCAEIQPT